jgi:hypothetical protein
MRRGLVSAWVSWIVLAWTGSLLAQGSDTIAPGLRCLQQAYPAHVCSIEPNALVTCRGERLIYDDGCTKTPTQRLEAPDLEDTFAQPYDASAALPPAADFDPGRARSVALLGAMYGATAKQVQAQLTSVVWMPSVSGRRLQVTAANGVDERLRAVSAALEELPEELRRQAGEVAGTFNHRPVAGTDRLSAHSYGIAIDVAPALADYWRWRERGTERPTRYRNRLPLEIVQAFEREGFIWGGRWAHYDTMHFEYRPELLVPACRGRSSAPGASTSAPPSRPAGSGTPVAQGTAGPPAAVGGAAAAYRWPHADGAERLAERVAVPAGFVRRPAAAGSFAAWLRDLPLVPGRGQVRLFDGRAKSLQSAHVAVLDIDTGARDLQQCADAVMRLRAEYLFASGHAEQVCFRAVSGDAMPYAAYRRGMRPPSGRATPWTMQAEADSSWTGLRRYLDRVFGIANTASLARELRPVDDPKRLEAGDVFIEAARGGRFGHAVLVLDVADNAAGERVFLIAQSYMPAQEIHVLVNPAEPRLSPWYRALADGSLVTPEWAFPAGSLARFGASCQP